VGRRCRLTALGRCRGGERRSCLHRPSGVGIRRYGRLVPAAHFQTEPSGGWTKSGACRSEGLVAGEHVPDRLGELSGAVDLGDLGETLAAEAAPGGPIPLAVERALAPFRGPRRAPSAGSAGRASRSGRADRCRPTGSRGGTGRCSRARLAGDTKHSMSPISEATVNALIRPNPARWPLTRQRQRNDPERNRGGLLGALALRLRPHAGAPGPRSLGALAERRRPRAQNSHVPPAVRESGGRAMSPSRRVWSPPRCPDSRHGDRGSPSTPGKPRR
jgi:hypothetical protein